MVITLAYLLTSICDDPCADGLGGGGPQASVMISYAHPLAPMAQKHPLLLRPKV